MNKKWLLFFLGCMATLGVGFVWTWAEGFCREGMKDSGNNSCVDMTDEEKAAEAGKAAKCNGVKLNTNVPFIGNCIEFAWKDNADKGKAGSDTTKVDHINAFPKLMGALMNIATVALLIVGFLMIVIGGVMMTLGGVDQKLYSEGKGWIMKVGTILALLGLSWVILKLINPTFFT